MRLQPVDLVFSEFLTLQQGKWLATTSMPFRKITFHRSIQLGGLFGWDVESTSVAGQYICLEASKDTLQVTSNGVPCGPVNKHSSYEMNLLCGNRLTRLSTFDVMRQPRH
jgi:hypothetical protein